MKTCPAKCSAPATPSRIYYVVYAKNYTCASPVCQAERAHFFCFFCFAHVKLIYNTICFFICQYTSFIFFSLRRKHPNIVCSACLRRLCHCFSSAGFTVYPGCSSRFPVYCLMLHRIRFLIFPLHFSRPKSPGYPDLIPQ